MAITRTKTLLAVAIGLLSGSFNTASALAEAKLVHSEAAGHAHAATKTEKEIGQALAALSTVDRKQAEAQRYCPIMVHTRLGVTGAPHKVMVQGTPVFVCCEECVAKAVQGGKETLAKAKMLTKVSAAMAKMPAKERAAAESQKYCAIATKNPLGSMGTPVMLELEGKPVFLCCKGCVAKARANPTATLAAVEALKKAREQELKKHSEHDHKSHKHSDHKH